MSAYVRRQRLAEAIAAQRAATRRVVAIVGHRDGPAPRDELQALADAIADLHGDTRHRQASRLAALDLASSRKRRTV